MAQIARRKNAVKGTISGILMKTYQLILPFIMRTIVIYTLGIEFVGLNSLFTSILQVLSLSELGVGSALVFSMYKPIVDDDENKICALMNLYKLYYGIIGGVILVVGIAIIPALPYLVDSDIPTGVNIYYLYILTLIPTVLSYWLFAYRKSVISAHQRNDVDNIISAIYTTILFIFQLIALLVFQNYYLYLIGTLISVILKNIIIYFVSKKIFPFYNPIGKIDKDERKKINKQVLDIFTSKIGGTITNSADSIVISSFLGLVTLGIYQNYYYIIYAVIGFFNIFYAATTAGIGNSILVESKEKNFKDFLVISYIISFLISICVSCFGALFQPFITLWVGEEYLLDYKCVLLFCLYFYVYELAMPWAMYKDASGLWHKDKWRPLVGSLVNLGLNLILVQFIGIYGILLSTIISYLFISMPWLLHNLFKYLFKKGRKQYIIKLSLYFLCTLVSFCLVIFISDFINLNIWWTIILRLAVSLSIPLVIFLLAFWRTNERKESWNLIKKICKERKNGK